MKRNEMKRNQGPRPREEPRNPSEVSVVFPRLSSALRALWAAGLEALSARQIPWLWQDFWAPGKLTLLTSPWKSRQTTLLCVQPARRKSGGVLVEEGKESELKLT